MAKLKIPVGYGNPPIHSRFKKGQSGNPGGRPKGAGSFAAELRAEGDVLVTLPVNGKRVRRTKRQFLAQLAWAEAFKGDIRFVELIRRTDGEQPSAEAEPPAEGGNFAEYEYEIRLELEEEPPPHIMLGLLQDILSMEADPEIFAMFPGLLEKFPQLRPEGYMPPSERDNEPGEDKLGAI